VYKLVEHIALDRKVIAVGMRDVRWWTAYIGAVKGAFHQTEKLFVAKHGTKLPQHLAEAIFPNLAKKYEWRE
jgi:hypothetical protein